MLFSCGRPGTVRLGREAGDMRRRRIARNLAPGRLSRIRAHLRPVLWWRRGGPCGVGRVWPWDECRCQPSTSDAESRHDESGCLRRSPTVRRPHRCAPRSPASEKSASRSRWPACAGQTCTSTTGGFFLEVPVDTRPRDRRMGGPARRRCRGLMVGQRVAADNTVLCGHCRLAGVTSRFFAANFYSLGVNGPGAFADYVIVRAEKCFPAEDLSPATAVMTEPTACAIHGMDVLGARPGSDVLLFGAGPTGLVLAQLLVHGGAARVTVAAPTEFKLALARRLRGRHDRADRPGGPGRLARDPS